MIFDANARKIVGHSASWGLGGSSPEIIWNQGGTQIGHPFHNFFQGFYTRLTTSDAFD